MEQQQNRIIPINISEEMKSSYIDYSMSVIVGRALPDVRDGLKPVHRRVLYGMSELGVSAGSAHKKSARIVGEVLGKYHPHGDASVYDTMVRMAQDFSMRYLLVDGQGNFGSVDGDSAAAMRYTEARLTRIAEELLRDIEKETVDFGENFDGSLQEPLVMPAAIPNLLVNGSDGIAVGMATKIPPHNLGEVVDGIIAYIDNPQISVKELMELVPAPDFPTGGIIYGYAGVHEAYATGRGRVVMRAKVNMEEIRPGREALIITEIPYQVNKSVLIEKIAGLVRDKKIEGISDLRDESDRDGMRIVIELKKDAVPLVVENQLYKFTQLQQTFGVNMVALVNGRPKTLTLTDAIHHYVDHRHDVVTRRTQYELRKAEERAHILEGLTLALDHLDAIITIIRHSEDTEAARQNLIRGVYPERLTPEQLQRMGLPLQNPATITGPLPDSVNDLARALGEEKYERRPWLSEAQADAILALRLSRLTGLERQKIEDEYREMLMEIERLRSILASEHLRMEIIKQELLDIRAKYADPRRTAIDYTGGGDIIIEDLIEPEQVVVSITHQALIKRTSATEYRQQSRGGVGMRGTGMRDEDYIEHLFVSNNHDYLLFFTDHGQCYWLRVYEIPEGNRVSKGRSIRNLIQIDPEDRVRAVVPVSKADFEDSNFLATHYVLMATKKGLIKKTPLEAFSRPRADGIIAISIQDGDELLEANLTRGDAHVILASSAGLAVRFHERDARPMGRNTQGVRGMWLGEDQYVVSMVIVEGEAKDILAISSNGYGKRSPFEDYRLISRGGKGVRTMNITDKTGPLVAIKGVHEADDLMIVTHNGIMIRMHVAGIRSLGRNTQGVRLISLKDGDAIADVTSVVNEEGEPALPADGQADIGGQTPAEDVIGSDGAPTPEPPEIA